MPIKTDNTGRRWVELALVVPGTPEQVWHAVATGDGNAAWFMRTEVEPRVGGAFRINFGGGVFTSGEVTAWAPPHHFGYVERQWDAGAPPLFTDIEITPRAQGCLLRMTHALTADADTWDRQMEGFEGGWPAFFVILRTYLTYFSGAPAASFMAVMPVPTTPLSAWRTLGEQLGLAKINVGEPVSAQAGPELWSGWVEQVYQDARQRYWVLRLDPPDAGVVLVSVSVPPGVGDIEAQVGKQVGTNVTICRYYYGDAVIQAQNQEPRWRPWLAETFNSKAHP